MWSHYRPDVAQRVGRGIALLSHDRGSEWSAACSGRILPPEKTQHPFCRRLGGPQGRSWVAKNLVLTGIRSRTVQPVVSRYTDWDTRATSNLYRNRKTCRILLIKKIKYCGLVTSFGIRTVTKGIYLTHFS